MISFLAIIPVVYAVGPIWGPNALNSGYGITTDYHGQEVPLGTPVTAYAATTEDVPGDVKCVVIIWLRPDGSQAWITDPLDLYDSGETWKDGKKIYWETDTRTPDVIGDWGIKAIYYNKEKEQIDPTPPFNDKVAIRATSFFHIPEVPLGPITVLITMLITLIIVSGKFSGGNMKYLRY